MRKLFLITLLLNVLGISAQKKHTLFIDGYVKDAQDTCYSVKNVKVKLYTDNGSIVDFVTDSTGYYFFSFEKINFKKATITVETSKYTASKICPKHGYLASREVGIFLFEDSTKYYSERKIFFVTPVTSCPTFPIFIFKKNSLVLDTIPKEFLSVHDSVFIYPNETLPFFAELLKDYPNYVIQLSGHASNDETNALELSMQRAIKIRQELIRMGIDEKRLEVKGYGSSRPIYPYEENIKKAKTNKQKEKLNAENRRCKPGIISFDYNVKPCGAKSEIKK